MGDGSAELYRRLGADARARLRHRGQASIRPRPPGRTGDHPRARTPRKLLGGSRVSTTKEMRALVLRLSLGSPPVWGDLSVYASWRVGSACTPPERADDRPGEGSARRDADAPVSARRSHVVRPARPPAPDAAL